MELKIRRFQNSRTLFALRCRTYRIYRKVPTLPGCNHALIVRPAKPEAVGLAFCPVFLQHGHYHGHIVVDVAAAVVEADVISPADHGKALAAGCGSKVGPWRATA